MDVPLFISEMIEVFKGWRGHPPEKVPAPQVLEWAYVASVFGGNSIAMQNFNAFENEWNENETREEALERKQSKRGWWILIWSAMTLIFALGLYGWFDEASDSSNAQTMSTTVTMQSPDRQGNLDVTILSRVPESQSQRATVYKYSQQDPPAGVLFIFGSGLAFSATGLVVTILQGRTRNYE